MPTIATPTFTITTPDGEVIPFDPKLAQNIGQREIGDGRFTVTGANGTFLSISVSLGATRFDSIAGPLDNVVEFEGRSLRFANPEFSGTFSVRVSLLNEDGSPVRDADGAPIRETFTFPVEVIDDIFTANPVIVRNPDIGDGAPDPVDPDPVEPDPIDPAPEPVNVINGGNGRDRLNGTNEADEINGNRGNDAINGRGGDDVIDGGAGRDNIRGGAGDDTIDGGRGNDNIRGGGGDDVVDGGAGRDFIRGGNGNDTIDGGTGNDVLFGGRGADTFVFAANSGRDVIRDFGSNDVIDLSEVVALNSIQDVAGALTQTRQGSVLDLGDGDTVLLQNVDTSSLQTDDFLF